MGEESVSSEETENEMDPAQALTEDSGGSQLSEELNEDSDDDQLSEEAMPKDEGILPEDEHYFAHCHRYTGGSCHWFSCHHWRHAHCHHGHCMCAWGKCSFHG